VIFEDKNLEFEEKSNCRYCLGIHETHEIYYTNRVPVSSELQRACFMLFLKILTRNLKYRYKKKQFLVLFFRKTKEIQTNKRHKKKYILVL
jgi:hypothetical protein